MEEGIEDMQNLATANLVDVILRWSFRELTAGDLDQDQLRTLVRVLDEDTAPVSIWNWQTRGVQAVGEAPQTEVDHDDRGHGRR